MNTTLEMESSNFIEVSPKLSNYDFNTNYPNGNIVSKIASDMRFEKKCKKLAKDRDRKAKVNE